MAIKIHNTIAENEPDWSTYLDNNRSKLPDSAFADSQGRTYPYRWVENGTVGKDGKFDSGDMYIHKGGLSAAWAAAMGAHTGQKANASIIAELKSHRKAAGLDTKNFAGLTDWFEVFKAGTHIDSNGKQWTFTAADLDEIAANYNTEEHEAPFVIGHPAMDTPAFGWIAEVKSDNGILFIKGKDVVPEFNDLVKNGRFKKRSLSLYPGKKIKHVGFLGAVPPSIKGLKDIAFQEDDAFTIEFSENWMWNSIADVFRRLREWFIETNDIESADKVIPEYLIQVIGSPATDEAAPTAEAANIYAEKTHKEEQSMAEVKVETPPKQFSEADVERIKTEAKAQGKQEAEAEFAETQKKNRVATLKASIAAFCEARKKEGRFLPAWEKMGLQDFLVSLDAEETITFAEGAEKKSRLAFMQAFLTELDKVIEFGEIAKRDKVTGGAGNAGEKLEALTRAKMKVDPALTYVKAFAETQKENPELAQEYISEMKEV